VTTPNIHAIAREGVAFTTGHAGNGTYAPSRAAILSGRYGLHNRYWERRWAGWDGTPVRYELEGNG
jgi:arylsulfatase A-like enzyme